MCRHSYDEPDPPYNGYVEDDAGSDQLELSAEYLLMDCICDRDLVAQMLLPRPTQVSPEEEGSRAQN